MANRPVMAIRRREDVVVILSRKARLAHHFALAFNEMEPGERARWEERINGYHRECGCSAAAVALAVAVCMGAVTGFLHQSLVLQRPFVAGVIGLLFLIAALGLGKALGLWIARVRLKSAVESLERRLHELESAADVLVPGCGKAPVAQM